LISTAKRREKTPKTLLLSRPFAILAVEPKRLSWNSRKKAQKAQKQKDGGELLKIVFNREKTSKDAKRHCFFRAIHR
jgi:hypothetical protein